MVYVNLPAEIDVRLSAFAKTTGRTKTAIVWEAILKRLDNLEDLYLAERRLADLKAGRSSTFSLNELAREYGMEPGGADVEAATEL